MRQPALHQVQGHFADHAGLFGQWHEGGGRERAVLRVVPAHQQLGAGPCAQSQVQLGLQGIAHAAVGDGFAQFGEQGEVARVRFEAGLVAQARRAALLRGLAGGERLRGRVTS